MCSLVSRTLDARGSITWQGDIGSIIWQSCHIMGKWTTQDPAVALLDFRALPGGIEIMCGDEALLDIRARAHFLCAAEQDAHRAVADLLEQDVLLGIRVRVPDRGDVLPGDAV